MRGSELHFRCRWLRQLILSNGIFHSTLRRIPFALLGIIILHLPKCWARLQYLTESSLEGEIEMMEAVQIPDSKFKTRFPDYQKWRHFQTSEMGCKVPWRKKLGSKWTPPLQQQQQQQQDNDPEESLWVGVVGKMAPTHKFFRQPPKECLTTWTLIRREIYQGQLVSRLDLRPWTGRTHQLRVHCAQGLGTPIVGDNIYGIDKDEDPNSYSSSSSLCLHARQLCLYHPITGAPMIFEADPPF